MSDAPTFPSFSLAGRRALVTGSSRGIGRAIASALHQAGASVAIHCAHHREQAEATARALEADSRSAAVVQADLSEADGPREAHRKAVELLGGPLEILVCNASVEVPQTWLEITAKEFERQVFTNWRSTLELFQLAAPDMQRAGWGRLVSVGSVQEVRPHPNMLVYAGIKAALVSTVENLARQLAPHGITVNNLSPGIILTDRTKPYLADEAYATRRREVVPLGSFGQPEDCAGAALLLCSDAGRYITGHTLRVDGGMSLP